MLLFFCGFFVVCFIGWRGIFVCCESAVVNRLLLCVSMFTKVITKLNIRYPVNIRVLGKQFST